MCAAAFAAPSVSASVAAGSGLPGLFWRFLHLAIPALGIGIFDVLSLEGNPCFVCILDRPNLFTPRHLKLKNVKYQLPY